MRATELVDDVIVYIASQCLVPDIIALSQTCSRFRSILAQPQKQLWLKLLESLDDFTQPKRPDGLGYMAWSDLPSDSLRDIVLRAYRSRANWTQRGGPRTTMTRRIDLKNRGGFFGSVLGMRNGMLDDKRVGIKFVRGCGGRYVTLLWTTGYLQVWDTKEANSVWTYPALGGFADEEVVACDSEIIKTLDSSEERLILHAALRTDDSPLNAVLLKEFSIHLTSKRVKIIKKRVLTLEDAQRQLAFSDMRVTKSAISFQSQCPNVFTLADTSLRSSLSMLDDTSMLVCDSCFALLSTSSSGVELKVIDAQHLLPMPIERQGVLSGQNESVRAIHRAQINNNTLCLPTPTSFLLSTAAVVSVNCDWRPGGETRLYVVANLRRKQGGSPETHTYLCAYEASAQLGDIGLSPSSNEYLHRPLLSLIRMSRPARVPLAHPYLSEIVTTIGRGGRGLLASVNQKNSKIRYFAFSIEKLFAADELEMENGTPVIDVEPFGPVHFQHDTISPGTITLEPNGGAVAFTRDDPTSKVSKELVIQYYD